MDSLRSKIFLSPGISRFFWLLLLLTLAYIAWAWSYRVYLPYFPYGENTDASSYLIFLPTRTAGYPLFLDLVIGMGYPIFKVQIILQAGAIAFLGWSLYRVLAAPWLAAAAVVLLLALCTAVGFPYYIMSEALFLPLLYLMLGMLVLSLGHPKASLVFCAALLCGLAIAVRPAGMALLLIWPLLLWFIWVRYPAPRWRLLLAVLVPLAFCYLAEGLAWHSHHSTRENRPTQANLHLFVKLLLIESEPVSENEWFMQTLAEYRQLTAPMRKLLDGEGLHWKLRAILQVGSENAVQYFTRRPNIPIEMMPLRDAAKGHFDSEMNHGVLVAMPGAWLGNALLHYAALWFHHRVYGEELMREYLDYVQDLEESFPFQLQRLFPLSKPPVSPKPQWILLLNYAGTKTLFLASLAALGLAAWQGLRNASPPTPRDNGLFAAALCALIVHGYFLVTGLFSSAAVRYSMTLWGVQILCALLLLHWGLGRVLAKSENPARSVQSLVQSAN